MKVLITGWSGTGKTTICQELRRRQLNAFDGDNVPNLSTWVSRNTGEKLGRGYPKDYSHERYDWNWDSQTLHDLLTGNDDIFLCGNANNAPDFYSYFTHLFFLDISPSEQRRRIGVRTEHDYGKDLTVQNMVIEQQLAIIAKAKDLGGIIINAHRPPSAIVDDILEHLS